MMTNRIIRDIRFYELRPENYSGPFDGTIGNIYKKSLDTRYIGQRVALKLNELCFVSGIFDHVYIYMSPFLPDNEMEIQRNELDERFKTVHFGIKPSDFNSLNESNKNLWAKDTIFKVLYFLFNHDLPKVNQIKKVEALIEKFNQDIEIFYSSKETRAYKIDINFQIKPNGNSSRILLTYCDKKKNTI